MNRNPPQRHDGSKFFVPDDPQDGGVSWIKILMVGAVVICTLILVEVRRRTHEIAGSQYGTTSAASSKSGTEPTLDQIRAEYTNLPPSALTALNALKKFQAKTEVGLTKIAYVEALGTAWGEVKIFIESNEGRKLSEFSRHLHLAFSSYEIAGKAWYPSRLPDYEHEIIEVEADTNLKDYTEAGNQIISTIKKIQEQINQNVDAGQHERNRNLWQMHEAAHKELTQFLWTLAGYHISKANKLLNL